MKKIIRLSAIMLVICVLFSLAACTAAPGGNDKDDDSGKDGKDDAPLTTQLNVIYEKEFGGVYLGITIDDFNALGFEYGDSVNISFSNGYKLEDIPYYTGYYVRTGMPLLVAYPGYPYIDVCVNNGDSLWVTAGLEEGDFADVTLNKRAEFLDIQNARNLVYEDERSQFPSDEVFANFRSVAVSAVKPNMLYRSASPCDNKHNRASYADKLIEEAGVAYVMNLSDTDEKILDYEKKDDFNSPYYASLYEKGEVYPMALDTNFSFEQPRGLLGGALASEKTRHKVADGVIDMIENDGPYLVHCTEGKDRTGFICMMLEALCGAGYDEIVADYMITYDNYYQITAASQPDKYEIIVRDVLNPLIYTMANDDEINLATADLASYAEVYLLTAGVTQEQIETLKAKLKAD